MSKEDRDWWKETKDNGLIERLKELNEELEKGKKQFESATVYIPYPVYIPVPSYRGWHGYPQYSYYIYC